MNLAHAPLPTPAEPDRLEAFAHDLLGHLVRALLQLAGQGKDRARQAFDMLVLAELMLRRLIYLAALRIDLPVPAATNPSPGTRPPAATPGAARMPGLPRFQLVEPLPREAGPARDPRPLLDPADCPRITVMDAHARPWMPEPVSAALPGVRPDLETRYLFRAQALAGAFANLNDEAQSWILEPEGTFRRVRSTAKSFSAHTYFMTNPSLSGRGSALKRSRPVRPLKVRRA